MKWFSRTLVALGALSVCLILGAPQNARGFGETALFHFAQIRYDGGSWNPNPSAGSDLMKLFGRYTSVRVAPTRRDVRLSDPELFNFPFLYLTGCGPLPEFEDEQIQRLRRHLVFGGTLLVDDCLADPNGAFAKSARKFIAEIFPSNELEALSDDHVIFKTYFLIEKIGGRHMASDHLEGVTINGRTVLVYSPNDLGGAWAKTYSGDFANDCTPGGEAQRMRAIKTGLNIAMYSLTIDYKDDQVHLPFIMKRRR